MEVCFENPICAFFWLLNARIDVMWIKQHQNRFYALSPVHTTRVYGRECGSCDTCFSESGPRLRAVWPDHSWTWLLLTVNDRTNHINSCICCVLRYWLIITLLTFDFLYHSVSIYSSTCSWYSFEKWDKKLRTLPYIWIANFVLSSTTSSSISAHVLLILRSLRRIIPLRVQQEGRRLFTSHFSYSIQAHIYGSQQQ